MAAKRMENAHPHLLMRHKQLPLVDSPPQVEDGGTSWGLPGDVDSVAVLAGGRYLTLVWTL